MARKELDLSPSSPLSLAQVDFRSLELTFLQGQLSKGCNIFDKVALNLLLEDIKWTAGRCRTNMAYARLSRPDFGLASQVKALEHLKLLPFRSEADGLRMAQRRPSTSESGKGVR